MTLIVPFFFAHQPLRLRAPEERRPAGPLAPGQLEEYYFDDALNRDIFLKVAHRCYFPATRLILDMVRRHAGREKPFRVAYGLSGTLLDQARRDAPDLLDLWKELADTGLVEFTGETYYHSLAGLFDDARLEFRAQAAQHREAIRSLFGQTPAVFRNTEMLYNDAIAAAVQDMGYRGIMTEGVDWLMAGWRSPDFVYQSPCGLPVLLRNYRLSDDLGYRFADRSWDGYPLTAEKFAGWLAGNTDPVVLLALDYEALGEHIGADTGIFDFLAALPDQTARFPQLEWATPSQAIARISPSGQVDVPIFSTISWADRERDTSAWLGNEMQQFCYEELKRLEPLVAATGDADFRRVWRLMQTSDHLYYLSDKAMSDGDVHQYFSAYGTVVEAFVRLHTAVYDLKRRAERYDRLP
ncbi:MAG: glycoside hydrolase family 57 protein [Armatimonadetes bacterium]|nr:glycoside hydrolase family 57 protein [Armatimonadota bacterium]